MIRKFEKSKCLPNCKKEFSKNVYFSVIIFLIHKLLDDLKQIFGFSVKLVLIKKKLSSLILKDIKFTTKRKKS